eukprot:3547783-Amphidinium_carterae.1
MRITSYNELDIKILQVRAIQGFFTDNKGEESLDLERTAALYNPVAHEMSGRFGYHTTQASIKDFQKSGIIAGGPAHNGYSWHWDIWRECVHMTPVAPMHPEAIGIWKSEGHGRREGKITLIIDLLMFTEECEAQVYQARNGIFLTRATVPWFSIVGYFKTGKGQRIHLNPDYGFFRARNSPPVQESTGSTSAKQEAPEDEEKEPKQVPREEARAEDDTTAEPLQYDYRENLRGTVEEKGQVFEAKSENLTRRLKEFLERQGRTQVPESPRTETVPEEEQEGEEQPAQEAEGEGGEEGREDEGERPPRSPSPDAEQPRAKMPRLGELKLAPGLRWAPDKPKEPIFSRIVENRGLKMMGMVDHFGAVLPTVSRRFSVHSSIPECDLPPDHECWEIWPRKFNNLPNTFATHTELYGFKERGSELRVVQDKYERALRGPIKKTMKGPDGKERVLSGVPSCPDFRRLAGIFDTQGNWIPHTSDSPEEELYVKIMHYQVTEAVSWMLGGYDDLIVLKDENRVPYQVKFGLPSRVTAYQLKETVGANLMPVQDDLRMNKLDWEKIVQRIWPQELNFFHVDAPTRRRHCLAHYQAHTVTEEEYRFIAISAGLPDEKAAFAAAQELGAWTLDLLWKIRRLLVALISKLTKQQEEAFWQWYPGYGYARPNYNTAEDRNRRSSGCT